MLFIFMYCLGLLTHSLFISFFLFASCTVLLICLFSEFYVRIVVVVDFFLIIFFYERAMSSPEK